ncbi:hypothetical protein [Pseudomonas putida]|uniref:Uncharacterized protein n=1 Tax=Pseudomonas putida TaxID=303 RepID=A0A8I1EFJ2_PSEPU|nr:hypothetical protein [Pseudomonas putida]MBI6884298.1 hypothetical protein [Pseudomonas putida]
MSHAIDYFAFNHEAYNYYIPSAAACDEDYDAFDFLEPEVLGKNDIASYVDLTYDSILIPSSLESSKCAAKHQLLRSLESYAALKAGWDGYSADPANAQSIMDARVFISTLPEQYVLPKDMLASDGEVSLYWECGDTYLEVSFPGDNTYHFIFNAPGIREGRDDLPVTCPLINPQFISFLACI